MSTGLTIQVGQSVVPDVRDKDQATAESDLAAQNLTVAYGAGTFSDTIALGRVVNQSPAPNADADAGSTVTLTLSLGVLVASQARAVFAFGFQIS